MRPSWDSYWLGFARVASRRSTCSRLSVGAVVVRDNKIVSTGYNGNAKGVAHCDHHPLSNAGCKTAIHAEVNAIEYTKIWGQETLYVTHAPCLLCARLIDESLIGRVVFADHYKNTDGIDYLRSRYIDVERFGEL